MSVIVLIAMTVLKPKESFRSMIEVRNISKRFGDFRALDDVSIEVESGSLTALLGPSGSGQVDPAPHHRGARVARRGRDPARRRGRDTLTPQKRGVGFVFQHYAAFKHMTVRDNIAFGLKIRKRPKDEINAPRRRAARRSCS